MIESSKKKKKCSNLDSLNDLFWTDRNEVEAIKFSVPIKKNEIISIS